MKGPVLKISTTQGNNSIFKRSPSEVPYRVAEAMDFLEEHKVLETRSVFVDDPINPSGQL